VRDVVPARARADAAAAGGLHRAVAGGAEP
jgi:hypothetical protein